MFNYAYNSANQRTSLDNADGSYWIYQYDSLGQVTSAKRYWSDGTLVAGQQFDYAFDDIGNRKSTIAGGDVNGLNRKTNTYAANFLNQYTNRTVSGTNDIIGVALAGNSVTINGTTAYRKGEYFQGLAGTNNIGSAAWQNVAVVSGGVTNTGNLFVTKTPETFGYDADGNLTNDGRWTYSWDGENRLTNMTSLVSSPSTSKFKLDFAYDWKNRRIQKIVSTNSGSAYVGQYTNKFAYDDWNLIAILNSQSSNLQSYVWGIDVSGSAQGAGGIGGLSMINNTSTLNDQQSTNFFAYDSSGNVAALVNSTNGTVVANYDYEPFGNVVRENGIFAKNNAFRFSTKYQDYETDLIYFGYRYYEENVGRWLSRDPINEKGGINLYTAMGNAPIRHIDPYGLTFYWDTPLLYTYPYIPINKNDPESPVIAGMTTWRYFRPHARVYQPLPPTDCSCGYKITVSGSAQVVAWWSPGWEAAKTHEMVHVNIHHYNAYAAFKENAESKEAACYCSRSKAQCVANVIENEMKAVYYQQAYAEGSEFDYQEYGVKDDPSDVTLERMRDEQQRYSELLVKLDQALRRCDEMRCEQK